MTHTKKIKGLLNQIRRTLDSESASAVEPKLRELLQLAKPQIQTKVVEVITKDPADAKHIGYLEAELQVAKRDIVTLRSKLLAAQRQIRDSMQADENILRRPDTLDTSLRLVVAKLVGAIELAQSVCGEHNSCLRGVSDRTTAIYDASDSMRAFIDDYFAQYGITIHGDVITADDNPPN